MKGKQFLCYLLAVMLLTGASCNRHASGLSKTTRTELYFGLSIPGGGRVEEGQWTSFTNYAASQVFKSGMSVQKVEGTWIDEKTKAMISEDSYVIMSVNKMTPQLSAAIDSLRAKYCRDFNQDAVMRIDQKARVKF